MPRLFLIVVPDTDVEILPVIKAMEQTLPGATWSTVGVSQQEWHAVKLSQFKPDDFARCILAPLWASILAHLVPRETGN